MCCTLQCHKQHAGGSGSPAAAAVDTQLSGCRCNELSADNHRRPCAHNSDALPGADSLESARPATHHRRRGSSEPRCLNDCVHSLTDVCKGIADDYAVVLMAISSAGVTGCNDDHPFPRAGVDSGTTDKLQRLVVVLQCRGMLPPKVEEARKFVHKMHVRTSARLQYASCAVLSADEHVLSVGKSAAVPCPKATPPAATHQLGCGSEPGTSRQRCVLKP
jgi:hypothetical protein